MLITDSFVLLNYPKTGSTFTRAMLKRVHGERNTWFGKATRKLRIARTLPLTEVLVQQGKQKNSQHGNYRQIPAQHRQKRIATVARNPLSRYISEYLYGWWKDHPGNFQDEIDLKFPNFPNLSFSEYFEMISMSAEAECGRKIGYETVRFVNFFFRDPADAFSKYDSGYIARKEYKDNLPEIRFLHQEDLNNELHAFLSELDYEEKDIAFIRSAQKINVTKSSGKEPRVDDFFDAQLMQEVLNKDKLLFDIFPEYAPEGYSADKENKTQEFLGE